MKMPVGILRNTETDRYHPIIFRPAPMASQADTDSGAMRHKSGAHHTEGLDTLELAQAWIAERDYCVDAGVVWNWTGEGRPAMVEWFALSLIEPTPETVSA